MTTDYAPKGTIIRRELAGLTVKFFGASEKEDRTFDCIIHDCQPLPTNGFIIIDAVINHLSANAPNSTPLSVHKFRVFRGEFNSQPKPKENK